MNEDISKVVQNKLTEAKKLIQSVPEVYRKGLCKSFLEKIYTPESYRFSSTNTATINSFHKLCNLYSKLCDVDKEDFLAHFSKLAKQFDA